MDLRIGVTNVSRELNIDLDDGTDAEALRADIEAALLGEGVLWVTDRHGKRVGVPVDKVAYVELGSSDGRRVGFATT